MDRKVTVKLTADITDLRTKLREGEASVRHLADEMDRTAKNGSLGDLSDQAGELGVGLAGASEETRKLGDSTTRTTTAAQRDIQKLVQHTKQLDTQIRDTESSMRALSREFATSADPKVLGAFREQESHLKELKKVRAILPSPAEMLRAGGDAGNQWLGGIRTAIAGASPAAVGAGLLAVLLAPTVGSIVAAAVVGGAGVGGVIGGVALAARNPQVKQAGKELGAFLLSDLQNHADGFVEPVLGAIGQIRAGFIAMGPDLDRIFGSSSKFVAPLTDGLIKGARGFVSGFADAVDHAEPVIESLRVLISQVGVDTGDLFRTMAQDAKQGASSVNDLTLSISNLITTSTAVLHGTAVLKGWTDQLDVAIDKGRYWLEDQLSQKDAITGVSHSVDLTADGFKRGSAEADAYRKATLGTASAADFATLKQAGMTDAQIAAADASGKYRGEMAKVEAQTRATDGSTRTLVASEDSLKEASKSVAAEQQGLQATLAAITSGTQTATTASNSLKQAMDGLYGAAIRQTDANEGYEASWDGLSASVKSNGRSLDIHSKAGRSNRDVLEDLILKNNDLYLADIAAGMSTEEAAKKHDKRTEAVRKEAIRVGFNKEKTEELIGTYGNIPSQKTTDVILDGVRAVVQKMYDLYILQRSVATGKSISSVEQTIRTGSDNGPAKRNGGFADGGMFTGLLPGAPSDVDNLLGYGPQGQAFGLAGGEYVVNARQTRKNLNVLQAINAGMDGFASGGLAPVDTSRTWPFTVDVNGARIPSKAEALSKVSAPAVGNAGAAPGGGQTFKWIVAAVQAAFPGMHAISTFRPGAVTLTGHRSYHAVGRAVDFPPSKPLAEWVNANYFGRTKELITPWNNLNIWNGQRHTYTGAVWNQHNFAGGNAHDHWAMAHGGVIPEPVFGVGKSGRTYSFGEMGPERVVPGYASGGLVNVGAASTSSVSKAASRLGSIDAALSAKSAIDQLTASLKQNGHTFSFSTQKGRDNLNTLLSTTKAAQEAAKAKYEETGSLSQANKVYSTYIAQLDAVLKRMKWTAAQRKTLLKAYTEKPAYDIPAADPSNSSAYVAMAQARVSASAAADDMKKAFAWTKPTFVTTTETGRAEFTQLFSFLSAAQSAAQTEFDLSGSSKAGTDVYNAYIGQLRGTLSNVGMKKAEIDKLLNLYGRITLTRNRWGGVYQHAAAGMLNQAQIAPGGPTQYAWAESSTGGELFAPKNGNLAKTRREVGWAVSNWWGGQVNWQPGPSGGKATSRPMVVQATIPITLGSETITRQVRIEVDAAVGQITDATVYQTA